ncbi:unnamed protein product, partial [Effrenium voratum]
SNLQEGLQHDYQILEQPMWEFFLQVYGGYNCQGAVPSLADPSASFEGKWRDGRPDTGHGRVFDPQSGRGFDGEIQDGFLWSCTGKGLLKNGSHFEGQVVDGLPEGPGREVSCEGAVLEGAFRRGKLHGMGRVVDAHGMAQEGAPRPKPWRPWSARTRETCRGVRGGERAGIG